MRWTLGYPALLAASFLLLSVANTACRKKSNNDSLQHYNDSLRVLDSTLNSFYGNICKPRHWKGSTDSSYYYFDSLQHSQYHYSSANIDSVFILGTGYGQTIVVNGTVPNLFHSPDTLRYAPYSYYENTVVFEYFYKQYAVQENTTICYQYLKDSIWYTRSQTHGSGDQYNINMHTE